MSSALPSGDAGEFARLWTLDPSVAFLNHGSFGACPSAVLEEQTRLRARLESEPVRYFLREHEALFDAARAELAAFLGASPEDLVYVRNATTGASTVLASLRLGPGDELLTTSHAYNACRNALEETARRSGAHLVVAPLPFPVPGPDAVVAAVLERATERTRFALIDHVTSSTGLVLPIAELVTALQGRGIDVLVDGAHAPGMVPFTLDRLGAAYYTGNCHKWLCAPKGAGFLHVRRDRQADLHPLVTSHGRNTPRPGRSRFHDEFDWVGTDDVSAFLCLPVALRFLGGLLEGGFAALRERNRGLVLAARRLLAEALAIAPPCPDEMIGSLAALPLPAFAGLPPATATGTPGAIDPLQDLLYTRHRIEVPIFPWPRGSHTRLIRVSAQIYNHIDQYRRLAEVLAELRQR